MKAKKKNSGISIRVIHVAMIVCAVIIAVLLIFSTYQSSNVFSTYSTETGNYLVRQKAAHDLMEASDYLTEMAQRFTLEGDKTYLNNYFEEAFVSKRREASILSMSENHADQALVQQLQEAMDESLALMYREYYAMKLVIEARNFTDYPDTLKAIELTEADTFLSSEAKMELAQSMVMGTEYYASKEIIRNRLNASLETLDQQMTRTRQETASQMMTELTAIRIITIVLTLILIVLIWLAVSLGTLPLIQASESIRDQQELPVTGAKEFRQLAEHYNGMYHALHTDQQKETPGEDAVGR